MKFYHDGFQRSEFSLRFSVVLFINFRHEHSAGAITKNNNKTVFNFPCHRLKKNSSLSALSSSLSTAEPWLQYLHQWNIAPGIKLCIHLF